MIKEINISTSKKQQIVDITKAVEGVVRESGVKEGLVVAYTPHATCAVIVNENYDPNILLDIIDSLSDIIPEGKWRHDKIDNNAAAHIKSSILGPSEVIPISEGRMLLGRWQSVMLADFDGPRKRRVIVKVIEG